MSEQKFYLQDGREVELETLCIKEPGLAANRIREGLKEIERLHADKDEAYRQRNALVAVLARIFPSGIRRTEIEDWDPEWNGCVYLDLPQGQASYHYHDREAALFADLSAYDKPYDGHTKEDVEARLMDAAVQLRAQLAEADKEWVLAFVDGAAWSYMGTQDDPEKEARRRLAERRG